MENIKYYKKNFLTCGIVNYSDCDEGILLLQKSVIDDGLKTIINKPVIIGHDGKEQVGEVVDAYYNTETGNYICGFLVWNDEAKKLLDENDESISCSYEILDYGGNGVYHNINYDEEAKKIQFIDLAIVDNPRYQEARQYINSIVNNGGAGSGNWGHSGRKGKIGGSGKSASASEASEHTKARRRYGARLAELSKTFGASNISKKYKEKYKKLKDKEWIDKEVERLKIFDGLAISTAKKVGAIKKLKDYYYFNIDTPILDTPYKVKSEIKEVLQKVRKIATHNAKILK